MTASLPYSSPREEALEIALKTRRDILSREDDPVTVLRACLIIAHDLGKKFFVDWIKLELNGYTKKDDFPTYRSVSCPVYGGFQNSVVESFVDFDVFYPVHYLKAHSKRNQNINIDWRACEEAGDQLVVSTAKIDSILSSIIDKCCDFLNETISELQFGGITEYLMEQIRKETDEKLSTIDSKLTDEVQSLYLNLTSNNPADWSKVGHSSSKILKSLADFVYPPTDKKYIAKNNESYVVNEQCFINRLYAFLDMHTSNEANNLADSG